MKVKLHLLLPLVLLGVACVKPIHQDHADKIRFAWNEIDDHGLFRGESSIEYEFCIPAEEGVLRDILTIEPAASVLKKSRGRVGCNRQQWLILINTRHGEWKRKLYAIAALPYVKEIRQVYYE